MIRFRSKKAIAIALTIAVLVVFLVPAFVAFRYTAPNQRGDFIRHPWRGWSFAFAAIAVPGDAQLKTSGMALRKADWVFKGSVVDPREVQLLFVPKGEPYSFAHAVDGRVVTSTVVPSYRFIWQVQGAVDTTSDRADTIVAMLDYDTGRVLYNVREDLPASALTPRPTPSAVPQAEPSGTP